MGPLPRPVGVQHDGAWFAGWLEDYRRYGDGWRALVRYRTSLNPRTPDQDDSGARAD